MILKVEKIFRTGFFASKLSLYFLLLFVFAINLSSHTFAFWPGDNWWLRSVYWFTYLSLDAGFIFSIYLMLNNSNWIKKQPITFIIATIIAWIPFSLAIASIDVATGRGTSRFIEELHNTGFLHSFFSQFILQTLLKHLAFGTLLYVLHFHVTVSREDNLQIKQSDSFDFKSVSFIQKLPVDVRSTPMLMQAQEHYINVTTEKGASLILYKFGKAVEELPKPLGVQTHRSFWVAHDNIQGWSKSENGIKLVLKYGVEAPVSRRFEHQIKESFTEV